MKETKSKIHLTNTYMHNICPCINLNLWILYFMATIHSYQQCNLVKYGKSSPWAEEEKWLLYINGLTIHHCMYKWSNYIMLTCEFFNFKFRALNFSSRLLLSLFKFASSSVNKLERVVLLHSRMKYSWGGGGGGERVVSSKLCLYHLLCYKSYLYHSQFSWCDISFLICDIWFHKSILHLIQ